MDPAMLRVEAFGRFNPRYPQDTPKNRRMNRRVDIVLDKRNKEWIKRLEVEEEPRRDTDYIFRDFMFDIENPEPQTGTAEP
jgi:chemotaxis protein MotB